MIPSFRKAFDGVVVRSVGLRLFLPNASHHSFAKTRWLITCWGPSTGGNFEGPPPTNQIVGQRSCSLKLDLLLSNSWIEFGYQVLRQSAICPERFPRSRRCSQPKAALLEDSQVHLPVHLLYDPPVQR